MSPAAMRASSSSASVPKYFRGKMAPRLHQFFSISLPTCVGPKRHGAVELLQRHDAVKLLRARRGPAATGHRGRDPSPRHSLVAAAVSAEYQRHSRGVAVSAEYQRRSRGVAVFTEYPRRSRGVATIRRRCIHTDAEPRSPRAAATVATTRATRGSRARRTRAGSPSWSAASPWGSRA